MMILTLLVALFVTFAIWVRVAPVNPEVWNVNPDSVTKGSKPNQYLLSGSATADGPAIAVNRPMADVAADIDKMVMAKPNVARVAGDVATGQVTYCQRSRLMAYPDYISVHISEVDGKTQVSVYSRSRFGRKDFGVNQARVQNWFKAYLAAAD